MRNNSFLHIILIRNGKPEKAWRVDIPLQVFGLAMGPAAAAASAAEMVYVLNNPEKRMKTQCGKDEICQNSPTSKRNGRCVRPK